jgi:UDP-glucose 4-epimerase
VKYIKGHTKDISTILNSKINKINAIFHFGEFSRIYQSFLNMGECINSNTVGLMLYLIFV